MLRQQPQNIKKKLKYVKTENTWYCEIFSIKKLEKCAIHDVANDTKSEIHRFQKFKIRACELRRHMN